jgi:hypothetical protein
MEVAVHTHSLLLSYLDESYWVLSLILDSLLQELHLLHVEGVELGEFDAQVQSSDDLLCLKTK